jgi:hypothetical protein
MKSTGHSDCLGSSFPESLLVVSYIPLYHGPMRGNTYKLLVEVDILVHNVSVADSCDM